MFFALLMSESFYGETALLIPPSVVTVTGAEPPSGTVADRPVLADVPFQTFTPSLVNGPLSTTDALPKLTVMNPSMKPLPTSVANDPGFTVSTDVRVGTICSH